MMHLSFTNIHNNTQTIILGELCSSLQILRRQKHPLSPPPPPVPTPLNNVLKTHSTGFRNWKHATASLESKGMLSIHTSSNHHKRAMLNWAEYKKKSLDREAIFFSFASLLAATGKVRTILIQIISEILYTCYPINPLMSNVLKKIVQEHIAGHPLPFKMNR